MVTLITEERKKRERTGFNYWSIPGCEDPALFKIETLDECIMRVFKCENIDLVKERKIGKRGGNVDARFLKRYCMERLSADGMLTDKPRATYWDGLFKYSILQITEICNCCHYSTIVTTVKAAKNLLLTDPAFRAKAEQVFKKIELNLIKFPEWERH